MGNFITGLITIIGMLGVVALLLGLPLMLLWNWIMPEIFYWEPITFWQAVGINLLTGILFRTNTNIK